MSANETALFWPLLDNILAAQRGRPYPQLDVVLRIDPTLGVPPDVRRALLTVAALHDDRVVAPLVFREVDGEGDAGTFAFCDWPQLPPLDPDPYPQKTSGRPVTNQDLKQFYRTHRLEAPVSGDDEHIAEREFLERVIIPVLGWEGLKRLTPQEPFQDEQGKQRRIDFVLRGKVPYALEVEGATYHAIEHLDEPSFDDETRRRRALGQRGYHYRPFTYGEIRSGEARLHFYQLCAEDSVLAPLLGHVNVPYITAESRTEALTRKLLVWAPERFVQVQRALLPLLARWVDEGIREVAVLSTDASVGILNLALSELLTCAEFTARLFRLDMALPHIVVYTHSPTSEDAQLLTEVLTAYLNGSVEEDRRLDRPEAPLVTHVVVDEVDDSIEYDASFGVEVPSLVPTQLMAPEHFSLTRVAQAIPFPQSVRAFMERYKTFRPEKRVVDYFARRLAQIPVLRDEQFNIICQLFAGSSQLAILPTAFGKSLCYQLPALLLPGVVFVVSPLRALLRDQMHGLEMKGLTCAEAISFDDRREAKERKMEWLRSGRFRVFYIAPERIQIQSFIEELAQGLDAMNAWALAVDEAHCVSEWGHDFRVTYLQLGKFRQTLALQRGAVPVLALTATASDWVTTDICHLLDIAKRDVTRHASVDRTEISLSAHAMQDINDKPDVLASLLTQAIPSALHRLLVEGGETGVASATSAATIIFSPYSNARGKAAASQNLSSIATNLVAAGVVTEEQIHIYSSKQPSVCPACGSGDCVNQKNEDEEPGFLCRSCGQWSRRLVPLHGDKQSYDAILRRTQEDFARHRFPVLVATKAYGMGIDKRNIRAIVHYAFADGLEAYVQEMGRAGRDRQHAHAALLYAAPAASCAQLLNRVEPAKAHEQYELFEPDCVRDPRSFKYLLCPHGLKKLCDYGLKARNIAEEHASVGTDVLRALAVLDRIQDSTTLHASMLKALRTADGQEWLFPESKDPLQLVQFGLYRLQQIGLVTGWSVDYRGSGLKDPPLQVEVRRDWTVAIGIQHLEVSLRKLNRSISESTGRALTQVTAQTQSGAAGERLAQAATILLRELLTHTHSVIKGMRYYMLWSELQYATAEEVHQQRTCRRQYLRRVFDDTVTVQQESCGSCDVCCPDMQFDATRVAVSVTNAALDELSRQLPRVFAEFDMDLVDEIVSVAEEQHALLSLQGQAEQRLVVDPGNVSAAAVAGRCALARGREETAFLHFSAGYLGNETGARELPVARYFYEQARSIDSVRALDLLDKRGGMFDTADGHIMVLQELEAALAEQLIPAERVTLMRTVAFTDQWLQDVRPQLEETFESVAQSVSVASKGSGIRG